MNPHKMIVRRPWYREDGTTVNKYGVLVRPLTELERMASAQRGFIRRARKATRHAK